MNVSTYVGLRFSFSARGSAFLSFITRVSMIGLMLGVIALVVVVSVMNGFDSQLKYRILGAVPHMVVKGELPESISALPEVKATARFQQREGILIQGSVNRMAAVYGIEPEAEAEISIIPEHMKEGQIEDLEPGKNRIVIGVPLAARLGLGLGDTLLLLIPEPSKAGNTVVPKIARMEVAGTFELQSELDYSLVLMHLTDLKKITKDSSSEYRLTLNDIFHVGVIKNILGEEVDTQDWSKDYGDFFETVRMEKMMMFVLLTLIVMIAAFNTVSGLSMMVKEKQNEIAVLRTMGMSRGRIMHIFMVQGSFIGLVGTMMGILIGIPLAYHVTEVVGFVEDLMGNRMLAGTYFDRVPTDVRWLDIAVIIFVSFSISLLATLFPAYRAAKIEPAVVLRAE